MIHLLFGNPASRPSQLVEPRAEATDQPGKKTQCTALSRAGNPCRAFAHGGEPFRIFHDPTYRESQRANSAAGGRRSGEARAHHQDELLPIDLTTPQARIEVLGYILAATLEDRFSQIQSLAINRILTLVSRLSEDRRPVDSLLASIDERAIR